MPDTLTALVGLFLVVGLSIAFVELPPFRARRTLGALRERIHELAANANVDRAKRRVLIAQLLAVVADYTGHERSVHSIAGTSPALNTERALAVVYSAASRFPALKADDAYLRLMTDLLAIEGGLQRRIEEHNAAIKAFNVERLRLPWFYQIQEQFPSMGYDTAFDRASHDATGASPPADLTTNAGAAVGASSDQAV